MYKRKKNQPYYTNRHSCFLLQYHLVLVTKDRKPILFGPVKDLVYQTIQTICDEKGLVILEMNGEADHVHILFEADPFTCVGELVNVIKTKTSRFARKQYGATLLNRTIVASQSYIELSDAKIERSRQCYYVSACT